MKRLLNFVIFSLALTQFSLMTAKAMTAKAMTAKADQGSDQSSLSFSLVEQMAGNDFFGHFDFETFDDPTHGFVDYVRESRANYLGLLSVDPVTNQVTIRSDAKEEAYGRGRPSIRLTSKKIYNTGLFIMDVVHVPEGPAVWPAFWTFGPDWPSSGEIDIIEGINNQTYNQATLHTTDGCVMPPVDSSQMTGQFPQSLNCNYVDGYKGCTTTFSQDSFGPGLNRNGGGVYAMLWTQSSISVWFFPRSRIPANIAQNQNPDPSQWGLPNSYFQLGKGCSANHFANQNVVINTTFCGDWAGETFVSPDGQHSGKDFCNFYVAKNPQAFVNAYWQINYVKTFSVK